MRRRPAAACAGSSASRRSSPRSPELCCSVERADTDRFFSWTIDPPLTAAFMGARLLGRDGALGLGGAPTDLGAGPNRASGGVRDRGPALDRDGDPPRPLPPRFVRPLLGGRLRDRGAAPRLPGLEPVAACGSVRPGDRPLPGWLRVVLCLQALVMLALGAALFVAPVGAASLWPWDLTPLTGRAIGAFLVGFGAAAAFAVADNDFGRLHGRGPRLRAPRRARAGRGGPARRRLHRPGRRRGRLHRLLRLRARPRHLRCGQESRLRSAASWPRYPSTLIPFPSRIVHTWA